MPAEEEQRKRDTAAEFLGTVIGLIAFVLFCFAKQGCP